MVIDFSNFSSCAVVVVSTSGYEIGQRIHQALPHSQLYVRANRQMDMGVPFEQTSQVLKMLFLERRPIIAVCALGIVVRSLKDLLEDKKHEPPVLVCDGEGQYFIPLLGGHRKGNDLALYLAQHFQSHAAVTTASDQGLNVSLHDPAPGFELSTPDHVKDFAAQAMSGRGVCVQVDHVKAPWVDGACWKTSDSQDALEVRISPWADASVAQGGLLYRPQIGFLGMGSVRGCTFEKALDAANHVLNEGNLSPQALSCIVSVDVKRDEPALAQVAKHFGVPIRFFKPEQLQVYADQLPSGKSQEVWRHVGCHGVSEAAVLAAMESKGHLTVTKYKNDQATAALGLCDHIIDPHHVGQARGSLSVVGIGPGSKHWRSAQCVDVLKSCQHWVGYGLYLDLIEDLRDHHVRHDFGLGEEQKRVFHALECAQKGHDVALVCSGDGGIYGMATLVLETIDKEDRQDFHGIDLQFCPGISAFQAAASLSGAVVNHDFCAISLSDLLTDHETIRQRLRVAVQGDFVMCLYNPVSQRRRDLFEYACELVLDHQGPECCVVVARNLGRENQSLKHMKIKDLTCDCVDMLTIVMIGNSSTRSFVSGDNKWFYTPRGYDKKKEYS